MKHLSWGLHVGLTVALVVTAAGGLGYALGWGWAGAYVFAVVAGMGGAGWWMIDLQKYKKYVLRWDGDVVMGSLLTVCAVRYMGRGTRQGQCCGDSGNKWHRGKVFWL